MSIPTLPGVTAKTITSSRITTRVLFSGPDDGIPVLFVHGNASSATFWEEIMTGLPAGYRGIAPDLRGYGDADLNAKIDATRGLRDLSDDLFALLDTLGIEKAHVAGHSLGGAVLWQMMIDGSQRIISAIPVCPSSPYGFGGTKDVDGTPCYDDFAGSGGGIVSPAFVKAIAEKDVSNDPGSPRQVLNTYYFKPPFVPAREEELLLSVISEHTGEKEYPGDLVPSANWPNAAPGVWGPPNALSPKYTGDVSALFRISPKPPVLWVRGSHDQIISDQSLFDMGTLGALGAVPGWPGADVYPSQPMVSQTRRVLEQYAEAGGTFQEVVMEDTGHSPFIEKPAEFNQIFHAFIVGK